MFTLIENGELYGPEPLGVQPLLLVGDRIAHIGPLDRAALRALPLDCQTIDATGCIVTPGLIDPHEHLTGAGGEEGFATRMPEVPVRDIVLAGFTTVVGCLGTDMTTRFQTGLLGKVRQLKAEGISAYMYTGGYAIPPQTLTRTITDDLVMIDEVIGFGEMAISDPRCSEPPINELGRIVSQAIVGGMIAGKAGVTHFHVGPGKKRLALLRELLEEHETPAQYLYPTHITRSALLMDEAIALAKQGSYVDIDTVDDDLVDCLRSYRQRGGPMDRLTISSDAHTPGGSPAKLYRNIVAAAHAPDLGLELVLPLCTRNPAAVLKLAQKGRLAAGLDADVLVLRHESLEIEHVFARGRQMVAHGEFCQMQTGAAE